MNIYLAGRYSRGKELNRYAETLSKIGYHVVSRWHSEELHSGSNRDLSIEDKQLERERVASEDYHDILCSDMCVSFTESEETSSERGGRHVEFGIALASGKRCITVGPRENVFHFLEKVEHFDTFHDFYRDVLRYAYRYHRKFIS